MPTTLCGDRPSSLERALEARGLVDVAGQHHHRALVEDDVQLEPKVADGLEHDRLVRFPGGDDGAADGQRRHAELPQARDERRRGRLGERRLLLLGRVEEKSAVLCDHEVEQLELGERALQIRKVPAGDEDQLSAGRLTSFSASTVAASTRPSRAKVPS